MPNPPKPPDQPLRGMDYGVPPPFMLMANLGLVELWQKANCYALGYLQLPQYASFHDVPSVGILFEDLKRGREFFDLIKSWDCDPGSGHGTDITFITDRAAGSYTLTIGPHYSEMIKRLLDPATVEDFSIMVGGVTVGKTCSLSQHLVWLREQANKNPIVFMPASRLGEPVTGDGYLKSDVRFIDKEDVMMGTVDFAMTADESQRLNKPKHVSVDATQIANRRALRLKKFYAVTIGRLEHNLAFRESVSALNDRHERWQITQAACNIICADWFPDTRGTDGRPDFRKAYDSLRRSPEIILDALSLEKPLTADILEEQVGEDLKYLWQQVRPNSSPSNIEAKLRRLGLLK